MSNPCSAVPSSPPKTNRNTANFHSTLWGNYFANSASEMKKIDSTTQEQYEELKHEVRRMIMASTDKLVKKLELIDAVQRLGVAYHFEKEITDELEKVFHCHENNDDEENKDLNTVSLRFRLLRQQGIKISCDVFKKFKDDEGRFKASLISDVKGMLSLYEAAYLSIHGEDILDEAIEFTTTNLKSQISHVSPDHLADQINHALYLPLHKGIPRLETRYFLSIYPRQDLHNKTLLKFAILDFNMVQAVHREELSELTKWYNDLGFVTKLPYGRDRLVETYFWMNVVNFEPQYAFGRKTLTKVLHMMTTVDDTFDSYATFEEIKIFTEAVRRWNIDAIDTLPEYMKFIYRTLLEVYDEIGEELAKQGRLPSLHTYAIKEKQKLVEGYALEAEWLNKGYVPTFEEYLSIGCVTIGYSFLTTVSYLCLGDDIPTKEAFDWITNDPKIIRRTATCTRLLDDITSHKFEQDRGHIPSSVECYMKQNGVSEEETIKVFRKEFEQIWKDMNMEYFIKPSFVSKTLLDPILNLLRSSEVVYAEGDSFTNAHLMKDNIALLFKDSIPL